MMAATLLSIKSAMLLPKKEEGGTEEPADPRRELVERLLEYKMFRFISQELKDRQLDASMMLFRKKAIPAEIADYKEEVDIGALLSGLTLSKLHAVFESVIKRQTDKIDPIRSKFGKIEREEINLSDKIMQIQAFGLSRRHFSFRGLLEGQPDRMEVIVTFLGILELMKMGRISISQQELFEDIEIEYLADDVAPLEQFAFE